jgi:hypothetical protein
MFREVRRLGMRIENGRKHYRVIDPATGRQLAILPRGQNAYGGGRNGAAVLVAIRRYIRLRDNGGVPRRSRA